MPYHSVYFEPVHCKRLQEHFVLAIASVAALIVPVALRYALGLHQEYELIEMVVEFASLAEAKVVATVVVVAAVAVVDGDDDEDVAVAVAGTAVAADVVLDAEQYSVVIVYVYAVSYTHLTLPTIYSV